MGPFVSVAIDASVVIAWQNPAHVFHAAATQMIAAAEPPLLMSELNLAEVLVGLDRADWAAFANALTAVGFQFCTPSAIEVAGARLDSHLRMPDAYVIATARTAGATTILSLDAALIAAAQSLGFGTSTL